MLTRLRFKRDFRLVTRCLSDKSGDNEGKIPDNESKRKEVQKDSPMSATEKIQQLLKSMTAEPKIDDKEYRAKFASAPDIPRRRKQKSDVIEVTSEKIEDSITKAAGDVAEAIGGDTKQTEAELLSRVLGKINQTSTSLSDLLVGMKVDRSKNSEESPRQTRGQQVKRLVDVARRDAPNTRFVQRNRRREDGEAPRSSIQKTTPFDLNSEAPLGIFKAGPTDYGTTLDVWQKLKQREVALVTAQSPTNYYEKMIQWTEQGKVWKFPINNEQGMEEEQKVHFSEHIFLDAHLEGWCPQKGPIRHFMELVCVGLSKNAFYTVQEKIDHITWYKEYFESKKDLLEEVGAWNLKPGAEAPAQN